VWTGANLRHSFFKQRMGGEEEIQMKKIPLPTSLHNHRQTHHNQSRAFTLKLSRKWLTAIVLRFKYRATATPCVVR